VRARVALELLALTISLLFKGTFNYHSDSTHLLSPSLSCQLTQYVENNSTRTPSLEFRILNIRTFE